ncbi:MAG: FAD-dependent oxidoreductase [Planctomycetota bacterium]
MPRKLVDAFLGDRRLPPRSLSRRDLLRAGVLAAGGLLSGAWPSFAAGGRAAAGRRVIVVGAGFSGLACAYELASSGYDVKVFEARKRVGGRVLSLKELVPGKNVEGGGEMLGSNHPMVLAFAAKFGFEFLNVPDDDALTPMILGGRKLFGHEVEKISEEVETAFAAMNEDARAVHADEPWKSPDAERLDKRTTAAWIDGLKLSDLARKLLTLQYTADNGVATAQQSYLGNLAQVKGGGLEKYWTDTEVCRLKGGNQQFALRFAKELGDERLTLDCPVHEITATDKGMTVVDAEGRKHEADDVVLAIPPSTWPTIKFTPALPRELVPQMGSNVKYLAVVKSRFWREAKLSPDAYSDGDIGETCDATDGQGDDGPAVLSSFSGGPAADAIHRRPIPERQPAYQKELEILFPGFGPQFVKGQMMDWIGDPWTRAGYSFPAPGQVTTIGPLLRQGIGRLHFAGEHTCYQFVGYMEGALHSGVALAKRLAARDGLTPKS